MKVMEEIRRNVDALAAAAPAPSDIPTQPKGAGTVPAPPLFHGERIPGSAALFTLAAARNRLDDRAEVERLRDRVAELEHEVRHLRRVAERARAAGEKAERERTVRTMGGRLPSILSR